MTYADGTTIYNQTYPNSLLDYMTYADGRISLFLNTNYQTHILDLYSYLQKAANENLNDTFSLCLYLRDYRYGKGEREIGRKALTWLFLNYPYEFKIIVNLFIEYGRWDDIMTLWPNVLNINSFSLPIICGYYNTTINEQGIKYRQLAQWELVYMMGNQLILDRKNMEKGYPITLCAKWAPTENDSMDKKYQVTSMLCKIMGWTPKKYRKYYLSPLREYLQIVEKYMCERNWKKINFNKVPKIAMERLQNTFKRHTPQTYNDWLNNKVYDIENEYNVFDNFHIVPYISMRKTIDSNRYNIVNRILNNIN